MPSPPANFALSIGDLREVAKFAAESAQEVLEIFEEACPGDSRPRDPITAAWSFVRGGERGKELRQASWAALKAAGEADGAAAHAARAAMCAASAAYLHPLANATQVKHILGATAHAARAREIDSGGNPGIGQKHLIHALGRVTPTLISVLKMYPAAPPQGGRVGELIRELDGLLRAST